MKKFSGMVLGMLFTLTVNAQIGKLSDTVNYLAPIKKQLETKFPKNRTINLVFHGHSVPSGYWTGSKVHTLESYPHLLLGKLKTIYPYAVINVILTSIGGEWAEKGQTRFTNDVLSHKPDVVIIDYALNDLGIGLERSKIAWSKMIEEALSKNIKVILVTPSPDQREDITDSNNKLALHATQIRELAVKYQVGLADPFAQFQKIAKEKGSIKELMSHVNHPNENGHNLIAEELFRWFK
ncbi:SGNH/GDSL hydrolase family protein [Pedobacter helvus]|jgi:lysophospholipase L1-like esterase|uniref:SGNH/GDSL hydrolase family protein n=1 Tax=Pedobacter helvus TaxID=2563444 RepID=A0ABW9JHQ2_9SPHI|nr:GDSL-type esterase/lipase family protein [Pedobacter ureilyticus]